jgi:hypothetical protein
MNNKPSKPEGLTSFILGIISIFYMSPIFVPLAILTGIVALFKRQFLWGILGLICAFIGFITSPILLAALGLTALALQPHSFNFHYSYPKPQMQKQAPEPKRNLIEIRYIQAPRIEENTWV